LLLNSEGKKMGKTQKGAVWLDANKTTPFEFYQYWRNVDDADVIKCLKMLTFLPLDQIEEMKSWEGTGRINEAKEILAFELTQMVHGDEEATKAQNAARALFGGKGDDENMPITTISAEELGEEGISVLDLVVKCGFASSKSEARRLVSQGGIEIAKEKVSDVYKRYTADAFDNGLILKKGKKGYNKVVIG
ncbi:MAG: tyrosine--tRNA ligase, partial [Clostridia bacterium]|nr:tyrosine--tRNA ligase [Clostridia bacterium]